MVQRHLRKFDRKWGGDGSVCNIKRRQLVIEHIALIHYPFLRIETDHLSAQLTTDEYRWDSVKFHAALDTKLKSSAGIGWPEGEADVVWIQ